MRLPRLCSRRAVPMGSSEDFRVLVLGASGQFGKCLCRRMAAESSLTLIIAGRDKEKLEALKIHLITSYPSAKIKTAPCDIACGDFLGQLLTHKPNIVVHLAGPFQNQDYKIAKSCLAAHISYIDMADAREFVSGFHSLDGEAQEKSIFLITGASTIPALSSAVLDDASSSITELHEADYGICAGLKTGLGYATLRAVFSYCGKPYKTLSNSQDITTYGLDEPRRHEFSKPVGHRYIVNCDIPDHELFPSRYPTLKLLRFGSCIDVPGLAFILFLMSRAVRTGWVRDWGFLSGPIVPFMKTVRFLGSAHSGFFMHCVGEADGKYTHRLFEIIARNGNGLEIPVTPVVILIKRILAGERPPAGAYPCMGLISLDEFKQELASFPITFTWRTIK
jgi:hypothetical protein